MPISITIHDVTHKRTAEDQKVELLLDVLRRDGRPVETPCGGKGTCRKCIVEIKAGVRC